MASSVADAMVALLKSAGVRRVYGLPGDSLNGLTDALRRNGEITWQHVRHEEAAAFAAAGEAAITGELAVCAGELRAGQPAPDQRPLRRPPQPGAGAGDRRAHPSGRDRQRLLPGDAPAGTVPRVQRLLRAGQHARSSSRASSRSRCGPRSSAAASPCSSSPVRSSWPTAPTVATVAPVRATTPVVRPDDDELAAAAEVLNAAGRVTILAGAGCAGRARPADRARGRPAGSGRARPARQGVRRVRQPVRRGHDRAARLQLRLPGHGALRRAAHARHRLPLPRRSTRSARPVVQVDVRGEQIGRRVPVDVPLVGTVKDTIDALLPRHARPRPTARTWTG